MRNFITLLIVSILVTACNNYSKEYYQTKAELAAARDSIATLENRIKALSYPADQRLASINNLINQDKLDLAIAEINELVALFPKSREAEQESTLKAKIETIRQNKIKEEKRLKALGFKAISENTTVSINDIKAQFSGFKIATTFTYDSYDYSYYYNTADKGHKYLSASMNITSSSSDPKLPQCAIYYVDGDVLTYRHDTFSTKFARWSDYGSYLGNYHDNNNDFAKVNTVKFKIGVHLSDSDLQHPFVIVTKKECVLQRTHKKYSNPEISYEGSANFPSQLTLSDIDKTGQYVVIKKYNFNKL